MRTSRVPKPAAAPASTTKPSPPPWRPPAWAKDKTAEATKIWSDGVVDQTEEAMRDGGMITIIGAPRP
jgi:hypothetical protein